MATPALVYTQLMTSKAALKSFSSVVSNDFKTFTPKPKT